MSQELGYFGEIEAHWQRAMRNPLRILTPKEWVLIEKWEAEGIPLAAVLRGIDVALEGKAGKVHSLAYCDHQVRECGARATFVNRGIQAEGQTTAEFNDAEEKRWAMMEAERMAKKQGKGENHGTLESMSFEGGVCVRLSGAGDAPDSRVPPAGAPPDERAHPTKPGDNSTPVGPRVSGEAGSPLLGGHGEVGPDREGAEFHTVRQPQDAAERQ